MAGCSSDSANIANLKRLCETDGGLQINETAEVEGFYHDTGAFNLVKSDYRYVEFCMDPANARPLLPSEGCFRLSKIIRKEGNCYEPLDERYSRAVVEPYTEFLANHCIALETIDAPEAQYGYYEKYRSWLASNGSSKFGKSEVKIVDRISGNVIATYVSYVFDKRPKTGSMIACNTVIDGFPSYAETRIISKVLVPKR